MLYCFGLLCVVYLTTAFTMAKPEKMVIVGAGPVGSLAALYAAQRGYQVEVYELRPGKSVIRVA